MGYRLRVSNYQTSREDNPAFWCNFIDYVQKTYDQTLADFSENSVTVDSDADIYDTMFDEELAKFNAIDIPNSEFIEFKSEEDSTIFLLRFA